MRTFPVAAAFEHVLRSTLNNISFAFHVSWPWMAVILPINIISNVFATGTQPDPTQPNPMVLLTSLVVGLFTLFAFASIAVSWHRYILRDEVPQGMARLRADSVVWRYFGNTLLIVLLLTLCLIPPAIVMGLVASLFGESGFFIVFIPGYIAMIVVGIGMFYRWSLKLPAIALERQDYTLRNAWADTQGNLWPLVGFGVLFAVVMVVLGGLIALVAYVLGIREAGFALFLLIGVQIVVNWFATIMGVTVLTSLYGFFVEKREF